MYLMFATSSLRAANITAVFCNISVTCRQLMCCHLYFVSQTSLVMPNELSGLCYEMCY
jgi:hypothetical protein